MPAPVPVLSIHCFVNMRACMLAACLFVLMSCGKTAADADKNKDDASKNDKNKTANALPIRVQAAGPGTVIETLAVQGRLEVWRRQIMAARVAGVVQEFPLQTGQWVKTGDLIMQQQAPIEDVEAAAKATVKLERAKRDLARREILIKAAPEGLSASDLDSARDLLADTELELTVYRNRESNRRITAPFDGVVMLPPTGSTQTILVGQQLVEGAAVAELLDASHLRLPLDLPEPSLKRLRIGQEVTITAIADNSIATGRIATLPAAIDPGKGTGRVLVDISTPGATWRAGGFITAKLVLGESTGEVVVARDSVLYRENRPYAWVAEEHEGKLVVRRAWVDLGPGDANHLTITGGINTGDRVVSEGMTGLGDGVPVVVREQ